MPLLIADIGGSSSRWALLAGAKGSVYPEAFPGFNPLTGDPLAFQEKLREAWVDRNPVEGALEVVAYGAGCGVQARAERMRHVLSEVWPGASIQVETDLLGAARGLYGDQAGLVLILGTGMNTGHYDGKQVHTPMPSLGYVLGDEGSGADIGKHVLRDALYGLVPGHIQAALFPEGINLPLILEAVHRSAGPQAFVASFTGMLARHAGDTYVHDLVASRFHALARLLPRFYGPDQLEEVRATGSVAYGFREVLEGVMGQRGLKLSAVDRDPLPGLLAYHAARRG